MESIGYQCGIREHCFIDRTKKGRHVHYNIANPSSLRFRIAKKITYNPVCITSWQNVDEPPHLPITAAKVTGKADFLPMEMLCAWLRLKLGVPVETEFVPDAQAVTGVYLTREDGVISLERPYEDQALISLPGQTPQEVSVPMRTIEDCLTEELRRIDPDEIYAEVINEGWDLIRH